MQRAVCLRRNFMVPTIPKIIPVLAEFIQGVRIESVDYFHTCLRHLLFSGVVFNDLKKRKKTTKFLKNISKYFRNFWAIILEVSTNDKVPNNSTVRTTFLLWVLYRLALSTMFQTFLTTLTGVRAWDIHSGRTCGIWNWTGNPTNNWHYSTRLH
jgi:hypothetical protein